MQDRLQWAQAACARVMRPLVRLALAMGLKHPHLEELLRDLLLDEARRDWQRRGVTQPNLSQLSVTTGINRKDVTQRVRRLADPLPHTELSAAAKAFTLWLQRAAHDPSWRRLFVAASSHGPSFEDLSRQVTRGDVHHRAVLDELVRLGMAREHENQVELAAEAFVPSSDLQAMLAFLGDNGRDHLNAAVANTLGHSPPFLERAVFADGLTERDCEALHALVRQHWQGVHHTLVEAMTEAVARGGDGPRHRIRVGIYLYHEADQPREGDRNGGADGVPI